MRSKPEVTREMAVTTTQEYMYSNEKVTRLLNFSFRPVEDSIREICGYFLEDHKNGKRKSGGRISAGAAIQSGYGSGKTG
jgi:hypothetical protein